MKHRDPKDGETWRNGRGQVRRVVAVVVSWGLPDVIWEHVGRHTGPASGRMELAGWHRWLARKGETEAGLVEA